MQNKTLLAFLLLALSIMVGPITAYASNGNGDDNENGNGEEASTDAVQVTVQRGENETEEINVTQNVTVVVDFNNTLVTNETVTIEGSPTQPEPPAEAPPAANETAPPQNATITPPAPSGNETAPPAAGGNETAPSEPVPEPPIPSTGQGMNETNETPPTGSGNQTIDQNQTAPPIVLPPDIGQNDTTPVEGNTTAPPITETPPVTDTPAANDTVPTEPTLPPVDSTIPTDNGTVIVEQPEDAPSAINLALVESIQRGHIQHVTAYVTDDAGNEFVDETVTIKVVNAKGNTIQDEVVNSGETFHFKVGPNTSPQTINVYATLDSDPSIAGQGSYDVYPKARPVQLPAMAAQ